jgi:hypothetical protein
MFFFCVFYDYHLCVCAYKFQSMAWEVRCQHMATCIAMGSCY